MEHVGFDFSKEYGIVLEGGGAKGAYQIGVWKALLECGVKIKAVAGVSVGALNGALICMGDYDKAVDIWRNLSYSSIMRVDDEEMDKLIHGRFKDINLQTVTRQSGKILAGRGLDVTPLKQLLDETVDEKKIRESDIEFIMGTFNVSDLKAMEISAREAEDGYLKDYLMASSNFPLFKNSKLMGKTFLDGGITNNVPIDMLINRGYKNIIVVRVYGIGLEKKIKIPEDVNVIYIAPKIQLCNVLEFNPKKAARNMTLGYYDAVRVLKSLEGKVYYIDSTKEEKDYLVALLSIPEDQLKQILLQNKADYPTGSSIIRKCLEEGYPQLASTLKLKKNWMYKNLFYAIMEYCAKKLKIRKYKIYTDEEFCRLIQERLYMLNTMEDNPDNIMELARAILNNYLA